VLTTAILSNIIYNYIILKADPNLQDVLLMLWRNWLLPALGPKWSRYISTQSPPDREKWDGAQSMPI
jgi:hypothetical protein